MYNFGQGRNCGVWTHIYLRTHIAIYDDEDDDVALCNAPFFHKSLTVVNAL